MLTELPIEQLPALATRLPGRQAAMVIAALQAGNSPGRLWASGDAGALLWDQGNNVLYMGGPPAADLQAVFAEIICPASLARGRSYLAFCALPQGDAAPPLPEFGYARAKLFYTYPHAQAPATPEPSVAGLRFAALDRVLLEAPLAGMDEVRDDDREYFHNNSQPANLQTCNLQTSNYTAFAPFAFFAVAFVLHYLVSNRNSPHGRGAI